jgi:outer membrane protein assembly factor BamB
MKYMILCHVRLMLAAALVHACCYSLAADWPEFRGPTHDGVATAVNVPIEWSATDNIAWKQPIPGSGWSSPVLVDGKIYLTSATGSAEAGDVSLRALCIDAADGHVVWDVEVLQPDADDVKALHQKNSLASPTPIVDGGRVYVHFGHMGTAALDLDGNVLWRQTDVKYSPMHGNGGSPALAGDLLVFNCDGIDAQFVAALDRATGQVRWKTPRDGSSQRPFSFSTPLVVDVDGTLQVISPASGFVGAYESRAGNELWRVNYGEGFSVVPRPVFAHGLIYVATGFMRASVLAIDPRGARGDATESHVVWKFDRSVPTTPSLLATGNEIYFVADNGVATCLDALTGEEHWSKRLGGGFSASPVSADGKVYFLSEEGVTYVVRAATEYELLATNDLGERTLASPAVADGTIYLRTESHLWRIGR